MLRVVPKFYIYISLVSFQQLKQISHDYIPILSLFLQPQRTRTSEAFRSAKRGIMFSSDVTARGLDYPDVTLVLQVSVPCYAVPCYAVLCSAVLYCAVLCYVVLYCAVLLCCTVLCCAH